MSQQTLERLVGQVLVVVRIPGGPRVWGLISVTEPEGKQTRYYFTATRQLKPLVGSMVSFVPQKLSEATRNNFLQKGKKKNEIYDMALDWRLEPTPVAD